MENIKKLASTLKRIDGRGYKAYLDIKGSYDFGFFSLHIDHVQKDPFASPSLLRIQLHNNSFPVELYQTKERKIALEDFISRAFQEEIGKIATSHKGSGKSGVLRIDCGGQEVLERSCVKVLPEKVEIRIQLGLPARGRRILGNEALRLITHNIPEIVEKSCKFQNLNRKLLTNHILCYEDAEFIRQKLARENMVAFIASNSILPRESGVSDKPLAKAVAFKSPESLEICIDTPNQGRIYGMGIPEGVTLIVGGGYHGKSTLLRAVELGVYNHIPSDGRQMVLTRGDAVKIRAEDGRRVEKVDISSFIHDPPGIGDTTTFSTPNASGSTSQAANIIEALESGSKLLLFDEDTSATNFMIRDEKMQLLVPKEKEPITPFIDRVQELYQDHGVSSILVMGGSGDYFQAADTVILMDHYQAHEVTADAKRISREIPGNRILETPCKFGFKNRCVKPQSIKPFKGKRLKLDSRGVSTLIMGSEFVDLLQVEQLVDSSQTRAISYALYQYSQMFKGKSAGKSPGDIVEFLDYLDDEIQINGLDFLAPPGRKNPHNLARPRRYEVAAALNRLRTVDVEK